METCGGGRSSHDDDDSMHHWGGMSSNDDNDDSMAQWGGWSSDDDDSMLHWGDDDDDDDDSMAHGGGSVSQRNFDCALPDDFCKRFEKDLPGLGSVLAWGSAGLILICLFCLMFPLLVFCCGYCVCILPKAESMSPSPAAWCSCCLVFWVVCVLLWWLFFFPWFIGAICMMIPFCIPECYTQHGDMRTVLIQNIHGSSEQLPSPLMVQPPVRQPVVQMQPQVPQPVVQQATLVQSPVQQPMVQMQPQMPQPVAQQATWGLSDDHQPMIQQAAVASPPRFCTACGAPARGGQFCHACGAGL